MPVVESVISATVNGMNKYLTRCSRADTKVWLVVLTSLILSQIFLPLSTALASKEICFEIKDIS